MPQNRSFYAEGDLARCVQRYFLRTVRSRYWGTILESKGIGTVFKSWHAWCLNINVKIVLRHESRPIFIFSSESGLTHRCHAPVGFFFVC